MTSQRIEENNKQFEQVYQKTNRSVTLFLISKCKNFADVNDVLQEVYLEYYQILIKKGISYVKNEESFLISLCRKKLASYYSFWDRIPHKVYMDEKENFEQEEILYFANEDPYDLEEAFFKNEKIDQVKQILLKQPDDVQKIFYLYYTMDLRLPEIAKLLHMKLQTVKNKLHRTRKAIYMELKE